MVKHIVMWRLKEEAMGNTREQNLVEMKDQLERLKDRIEEIQFLQVGLNFDTSDDAYDILLYTEFEDREGLRIYQEHPEHIKARDFICQVRLHRTVVDFEI